MKKFLTVLSILIFALVLSSCGLLNMRGESNNISPKPDTHNVYYSALNINLVSCLVSDDNGRYLQYELQIGLRSIFFGDEETQREQEIKSFAVSTMKHSSFDMQYIGSYDSESLWGNFDSKNNYTYVCFVINPDHAKGKFDSTRSNFGFFFVEHDYVINNPEWVNYFRDDISSVAKSVINSKTILNTSTYLQDYMIDDDAVYFDFGFCTDADVDAENATRVQKYVLSRGDGLYQCLMWQADDDYDFSKLDVHYKAMASGWYVIAIILGAAVVVILFLLIKYKKIPTKAAENVFRADGVAKSDDIFQLNGENVNNVIDGQISMEEYVTSDKTKEAEQTTEINSEDSNAD